jgi:hypothetical protein
MRRIAPSSEKMEAFVEGEYSPTSVSSSRSRLVRFPAPSASLRGAEETFEAIQQRGDPST